MSKQASFIPGSFVGSSCIVLGKKLGKVEEKLV